MWDTEPGAEIIPECGAEFGCGAHQSEEGVATVATDTEQLGIHSDCDVVSLQAVSFGSGRKLLGYGSLPSSIGDHACAQRAESAEQAAEISRRSVPAHGRPTSGVACSSAIERPPPRSIGKGHPGRRPGIRRLKPSQSLNGD